MPGRPTRPLLPLSALLLAAFACSGDGRPGTGGEGARLLVASGFTDQVLVLDPGDGRIVDSIPVDARPFARDEPHGIAVSPTGDRWFVTLAHGEPQLRVYERPGHRLIGSLPLPMGGASRVSLDPEGTLAFIPDYGRSAGDRPGEVARIRTGTLEITHRRRICPAPHEARVDPTGSRVLVTCAFSDEVVFLSPDDLTETARVFLGEGSMPMNAAWSSDGTVAWITLMNGDRIATVDRDGALLGTTPAGMHPVSVAVTPDDRHLLVTNRGERSLSLYDLRAGALPVERLRVPLGDAPHPQGLALDASGETAFVGFEGEVGGRGGVIALRIDDAEILWRTVGGAFVLGVAWAPPIP